MQRSCRGIWILLVLLLCGCCAAPPRPTPTPGSAEAVPKQLRHQQVVVVLAAAPQEQWPGMIATLQQQYQLEQVGAFPLLSIGVQCVVFRIPDDRSVPGVLQQLRTSPLVDMAQPNQSFQGLSEPGGDPYLSLQYGIAALQAHAAHRIATGKGVQVAVIDTGVAIHHADLQGQIIRTANFVDGGEASFQSDRHGTAVAGVIVAKAGNALGIRGVAPDAAVVAVKACWHQTASQQALCSSWSLARALDFAITARVHILNVSLSGPRDLLLGRLLQRAEEQGIVAVAAVPPGDAEGGFPAALESVIAVLPSDRNGQVYGTVRPGAGVALAAPGMEILTTLPQQTYDFVSGSSLATAHVSGLLALLLERFPGLSPQELRQALRTASRAAQQVGHSPLVIPDACALLNHLASAGLCRTSEREQQSARPARHAPSSPGASTFTENTPSPHTAASCAAY